MLRRHSTSCYGINGGGDGQSSKWGFRVQLKATVSEMYQSLQATTQTFDHFLISEDDIPEDVTSFHCDNEEPASKSSKKGTEYKEDHYEVFGMLGVVWPPSRDKVIDGCAVNYDLMHARVAEAAICMHKLYNDITHISGVEFFDGNNSLKRLLSWDDDKMLPTVKNNRGPWRKSCPTLTTRSQIIVRFLHNGKATHMRQLSGCNAWILMERSF